MNKKRISIPAEKYEKIIDKTLKKTKSLPVQEVLVQLLNATSKYKISSKNEISLCKSCYCMTKTIKGKCGKCKKKKS